MVGVAENLNVLVSIKLRCGLKKTGDLVMRRQNDILSGETLKRVFHSAVETLFWPLLYLMDLKMFTVL